MDLFRFLPIFFFLILVFPKLVMFFFFRMGIFLKACAFKQLAGRCAFPSSCAVVLWFDAGLWSFCCTFKNSFILLRLTCTNGTTEKTTIMHGPMWPNDTDPFPVVVKKCCEICCSKPANFKRNIKQKTLDPRGSTPKWIEQKNSECFGGAVGCCLCYRLCALTLGFFLPAKNLKVMEMNRE